MIKNVLLEDVFIDPDVYIFEAIKSIIKNIDRVLNFDIKY